MLLLDDTTNLSQSDAFNDEEVQGADSVLFNDDNVSNDFSGTTARTAAEQVAKKSESSAERKRRLIDRAKRMAGKKLSKKYLGDTADTKENRDRVKDVAAHKARKFVKNKVGSKIKNEALKKGFEKGFQKGTKKIAKKGVEKAVEVGAKKASGAAVKTGARAAVDVAGAATGFETFGLGFLLAFLLNIAISLGVSDCVDALFELKKGEYKQALFLVHRACAKVGVFIYLLIALLFMLGIASIFIAVPMLILLHIYYLAGQVFKKVGLLQGLVWWELAILVVIDIIAFLILMAFIASIGYYLCSTTGMSSGGVTGAVSGAIGSTVATVYDWWNGSNAGSFVTDYCKAIGPIQ